MAAYLTREVPGCGGAARTAPEDFEVEELPAYPPSGEGEHLYLWLEKRGVDTPAVVRALARGLGIGERDIGYAGLKDRRAVTRQLVSVPARLEPKLAGLALPGATVLWTRRHGNKLRTGHLHGNRFRIRLREVKDPGAARESFGRLVALGLPNAFGAQRFGMRGDNAEQGKKLVRGERLAARPDRFRKKLYLSALQSALFNALLSRRLDDGSWSRAQRGDVLRKAENGGLFVCEDPAVEQPRLDAFELSVAGPLFGPRMVRAQGAVAALEEEVLRAEGLEQAHFEREPDLTQGARRAYRVRLGAPRFELDGADVVLGFELPRGSYATVVLGELLKEGAPAGAEEPDET